MSTEQEQDIKEPNDKLHETADTPVNNNKDVDGEDTLIEEQQKKIRELEEELERVKDAQLRKAAEMENMKKRLRREREQIFQTSREVALEAFLPINDDLLRTLKALEDADADPSYIDGVKLVADKFENVLTKNGVRRIDETGVPFDVNLHDAMLRQKPEDSSVKSGMVLQILENGYQIGDKTIRHAKVIVSE